MTTRQLRFSCGAGVNCTNVAHRHFHDPAPPFNLRCIECEDAWLDGLANWLKQYKRRKRAQQMAATA